MTPQPLSMSTFRDALTDPVLDGCHIEIHLRFVEHLANTSRNLLDRISRDPDGQRRGIVQITALIILETPRFAPGPQATKVALAIVHSWLRDGPYRFLASHGEVRRALTSADGDVDQVAAFVDRMLNDPLVVFVGSPITASADGTRCPWPESATDLLRKLRSAGYLVIVASEEAPPDIHSDFSDHPHWRPHDERWIRRSDIVIILHLQPATGLGIVFEIARSSAVMTVVLSEGKLSPMMTGASNSPHIIDLSTGVGTTVLKLAEEKKDALLQRRKSLKRLSATSWRARRLNFQRRLQMLSNRGLVTAPPTSLSRARLMEILSDDYMFGGATEAEISYIDELVISEQIPDLGASESRALLQTAKNYRWDETATLQVEMNGRELLFEAIENPELLSFHSSPRTTVFWKTIHNRIYHGAAR